MAFQQSDLEKLERAIGSGKLSVWYADRRVQYQSLDDMIKLRDKMRAELDAAAGKKRRRRFFRVYQSGSGL